MSRGSPPLFVNFLLCSGFGIFARRFSLGSLACFFLRCERR